MEEKPHDWTVEGVWADLMSKYKDLYVDPTTWQGSVLRNAYMPPPDWSSVASAASALVSEPTAPHSLSYHIAGSTGDDIERARLLGWARRQLARFTYKPGWTFKVDVTGDHYFGGGLRVLATMKVEDSYHPGQTIEVGGWSAPMMLPGETGEGRKTDEDWFAFHLTKHIQALEQHESQEWLRRDGKVFDDPHKNDPK